MEELKRKINELKICIDEKKEIVNGLGDKRDEVQRQKSVFENNLKALENAMKSKEKNRERITREISEAQKQSSNLQRYGKATIDLVKLIEKDVREGKFKQAPIGPIGMCCIMYWLLLITGATLKS